MEISKYIITLLNLPGIGRKTVQNILKDGGNAPESPNEFIPAITQLKQKIKRLKIPSLIDVENAYEKANLIIQKSTAEDIKILCIGAKDFPKKLELIPDPPVVIYVKGNTHALHFDHSIAIIGTREPTEYAAKCAEAISQSMASQKICIVSGLAKGCDSLAHKGCLKAKGTTIAILAHGLHMIYPAENKSLARDIINSGGCLVSEYPIGITPRPNYFVERDRLQTGLSDAVVFIETGVKGGTMHAVNACIKANKPLACLKHPEKYLSEEKTKGNQLLLSQKKSIPIEDSNDISSFLKDHIFNIEQTPQIKSNSQPMQLEFWP